MTFCLYHLAPTWKSAIQQAWKPALTLKMPGFGGRAVVAIVAAVEIFDRSFDQFFRVHVIETVTRMA